MIFFCRSLPLVLLLFCPGFVNAQNIVPNYSFEQADSCPASINGSSSGYSLGCVGWGQATLGHPDYFNACDTSASSIGRKFPIVGVPYNNLGHQTAFEGKAYAGINIYALNLPNYKEYLIAKIPGLKIDTIYKVTIEISLADSCRYATDALGVLFTTYGSPSPYTSGTLTETPQIDYTSYGVISDTAHWTKLTATFKADSAYTNLIIGGFKAYTEMNISVVNASLPINRRSSYYYIDNVSVEKLSTTGIVPVNINKTEVHIYPNPFTDYTTLAVYNLRGQDNRIDIYNTMGQLVRQINNITTGTTKIERDNLSPGFYYYQLRDTNDIIAYGKFIIS